MEQSLFIEWVQKYFKGLTVSIVNKLNDTNQDTLRYRHQEMLTKDYSLDGKWESIVGEHTNVAADIVSMDSELPLKSRDSMAIANGDLPKLGMKMYLTEKQLKKLDNMVATNEDDEKILATLFEDLAKVTKGVYERNELMFLRGLCDGITLAEDADNTGIAARVNYGYLDSHKFGVNALWNAPATSTPIEDIDKILEQARADGNTLRYMLIDRQTLRNLGASQQMKDEYAFFKDIVGTSTMPNLPLAKINEYMESERGLTIDIVDRMVKIEKNGKKQNVNPWTQGFVIFLSDYNVGKLVWTKTAEMNHPKEGVSYQTADDYILLSKYHKNDPIREFTSSQAMVLPVISAVESIYQLDTNTLQA